ncbi:hypothetical protein GCM10022221_48640 [Actinocorallia aurea]
MAIGREDLALERATLQLINVVAFTSGTRAHSRRMKAATGIDLPPSELRLLELLGGREPLPTSVVARELGIDLTQASRQAGQLEAAGHLVRRTDPADRRRTLVALSESTAAVLDRWLVEWSRDYLGAIEHWDPESISTAARWFALVHDLLLHALPDRPRPASAERWLALAGADHDPQTRAFLRTIIAIVTWVSQSRGYNDLLEIIGSPIGQHGFFTLQVVRQSGPLPIAEVADRLAIDPSQASKRLRQLTDARLVDRAVDGFDRRSSLIRVSRKGSALLAKVAELQLSTFEQLTDQITEADRERWTPLVKSYVNGVFSHRIGPDGVVRATEPELFDLR